MDDEKQMDTDNKADQPQELAAANQGLRLQPFWAKNAKLWFVTTEIQFGLNKITTDNAKYGQLLLALPPDACETVQDVLEHPPASDKYESLKKALLDRNTPSEEKRLEALLDKQEVGDRRPSEVLRHLRTLAGPNITPGLIKSLWVRKLPEFIKIALVPQQEVTTADELARIADKLNEAVSASRGIQAIQHWPQKTHQVHNKQSPSASTNIEERLARVEQLLVNMGNERRSRIRSPGRRRSRSTSRPRSQSRARTMPKQTTLCWYHNTYGEKAQKCNKPCRFNELITPRTQTNKNPN